MPRIPNLIAFGKHCHNCGKWMQRRALRKDVACNFCNSKIFGRNCKQMQLCSRCVECDNIILDNFNYCECCGLETNRQLRITKARALSNLFSKNQAAPDSSVKSLAASTIQPDKSQDLFDDFQMMSAIKSGHVAYSRFARMAEMEEQHHEKESLKKQISVERSGGGL